MKVRIQQDQSQLKWIADFIWNIADDRLRDVYVRGKYRDNHNEFRAQFEAVLKEHDKKLGAPEKKAIYKAVSWRDDPWKDACSGLGWSWESPG